MKFWILCIIKLRPKLEELVRMLDKKIDKLSLRLFGDTYSLCENVLRLISQKKLLINLKVMYDKIIASVTAEEAEILLRYGDGESMENIAKFYNINRSTVLRRMDRLLNKCVCVLNALGICEKKLSDEYRDFLPVRNIYNRIVTKSEARKKAACSRSA